MKQWFVISNDKIPYIKKSCPDAEIVEQYEDSNQSKVSLEVSSSNMISLLYAGVRFGMDKMIESNRQTA